MVQRQVLAIMTSEIGWKNLKVPNEVEDNSVVFVINLKGKNTSEDEDEVLVKKVKLSTLGYYIDALLDCTIHSTIPETSSHYRSQDTEGINYQGAAPSRPSNKSHQLLLSSSPCYIPVIRQPQIWCQW